MNKQLLLTEDDKNKQRLQTLFVRYGLSPRVKTLFSQIIYDYYRKNYRDFPWRHTDNAYWVLVSEIMLQQTQTDRVLPKFENFISHFPTFEILAAQQLVDVLQQWQGLGYNRRAKFLHQCAQTVVRDYKGIMPQSCTELKKLPGIGDYTAAAVSTFAFNKSNVFIETNIRSVYIHLFFPDDENVDDKELLRMIADSVDADNPRDWYYALMDYGVMIKKQFGNPNKRSKQYVKQSKFEGSDRQIRGMILKILLANGGLTFNQLCKEIDREAVRIKSQLATLAKDEMIECKNHMYHIKK